MLARAANVLRSWSTQLAVLGFGCYFLINAWPDIRNKADEIQATVLTTLQKRTSRGSTTARVTPLDSDAVHVETPREPATDTPPNAGAGARAASEGGDMHTSVPIMLGSVPPVVRGNTLPPIDPQESKHD